MPRTKHRYTRSNCKYENKTQTKAKTTVKQFVKTLKPRK